jgi:hypothetical protein
MGKRRYSVNIFPILQITKRYQLDSERLFPILLNFLSHRREEILNEQLFRVFNPFDIEIKRTLKPILYQLINELEVSNNVERYYIKNSTFFIEDNENEPTDEFW